MRKYYQLLLLVGSLLSLTLFLIYRHEYNRLHYVLEVFNFFGQPCNVTDLYVVENTIVQHDWGPAPLWYENDNFYTYSGFVTEKSQVKVIAIHNNSNSPKNCYLWFDDRRKPVIGKFRYSVIEKEPQESFNVYNYYCSLKEYPHSPYAVSFGSKIKNEDKLKKILIRPYNRQISFNTTVCVVPSKVFNKNEFIEFLSFHSLIGVESFIFYSDNIPYRLTKIITNLSTRLGIKITFFPWNHNLKDNIAYTIVENDCKLRGLSDSHNVITLAMDEYIVPSKFFTFKEVIENFNKKERIRLPVQAFCIKNTTRRKPIALQNVYVAYYNNNLIREVIRNTEENNVINISSANSQVAQVHKYIYCTSENIERGYPDNNIMKYSTDFVRSTLIQLLLHEQL